jgi:hypothetical protein
MTSDGMYAARFAVAASIGSATVGPTSSQTDLHYLQRYLSIRRGRTSAFVAERFRHGGVAVISISSTLIVFGDEIVTDAAHSVTIATKHSLAHQSWAGLPDANPFSRFG